MNCTLKVKLTEDECQKVDAACVRQTARRGAVVNRSDLVRAWIAAGCPVQPEVFAGPVTLHPVPKTALHMQAQHAERAEWPDDIGSGGAAPGEAVRTCSHLWVPVDDETGNQKCFHCGVARVSEKLHAPEPPAASVQDAHAGGADAPEKAGMSHKPADAWDGVK